MTPQDPEPPQGVVLAGGASARFGSASDDKALASTGSECSLTRIADTLRETTERAPIVVVRTPEQRAAYAHAVGPAAVQFAFDAPDYQGPLAGIRAAARAAETDWLFVCGCDMPLLADRAIRWLCERRTTERDDAVAVAYPNGPLEPLHTLYRTERVLDVSATLPAKAGPRALLSELASVHTVPLEAAPDSVPLERSTTNFNTHSELTRIREQVPNRR